MAKKNSGKGKRKKAERLQKRFIAKVLKLPGQAPFTLEIIPKNSETGEVVFGAMRCHENCERLVACPASEGQFEVVKCWCIESRETQRALFRSLGIDDLERVLKRGLQKGEFEAVFHSVVRDKVTGNLLDITPDLNSARKTRTLVLEPRMTHTDFERFKFKTPENIASPSYVARTPVEETNEDFFEMLVKLKMYKQVLAGGGRVVVGSTVLKKDMA